MKNLTAGKIAAISISSVFALIIIIGIATYNGLVKKYEVVEQQKSNIETQLQRRADLIPNLVNTVKGYVKHEAEIIKQVSESRAKLAGAKNIKEKADADSEMTSAISRLLVVAENYPDLKANQEFTHLSDELAGSENRLSTARKDYNEVARNYNKSTKTFPGSIFARMFNFSSVEYFQAQSDAKNSPKVDF
ncbi:MAG: LemA family protein [Oscillospiraceae bacterium]|jgi:LemA protein|nr:LemA family protein [Oscillospiraceae bacterium]